MMFISEDPQQVQLREEVAAIHDTAGRMISPKQRRIVIKFNRGHAPMWVVDQAAATFEFRKKPEELSIQQWVSWYDSAEDQNWTDEERAVIEERLPDSFGVVVVERPKIPAPWPAITSLTVTKQRTAEEVAARMVGIASDMGTPVGDVVAFVADNVGKYGWGPNLVASIQELGATPEPTEDDVERVAA